MTVKQLSVFIENRQGRLGEVLHVLKENEVTSVLPRASRNGEPVDR